MTAGNYDPQIEKEDDTFAPPPSADRTVQGSPLESLAAALKADVRNPDLVINVPGRPILRTVFDTNIDGEQFQNWQRKCRRGKTDELDSVRLSAVIIANTLKGIEVRTGGGKWIEATGEDGQALTFQSTEFRKMLLDGAEYTSAIELVRKLYGNDAHMMLAAKDITDKSGFGAESEELFSDDDDPTQG